MKYVIRLLLIAFATVFATCQSPTTKTTEQTSTTKEPSVPAKPWHFFVIGDWGRRGAPEQLKVANQMIKYADSLHPAFIVTTGDNFYEEGVESVTDTHWKESFTNVYKNLATDYNWYAVLGNHEYQGKANPQAEIDYHAINPRWNMDDRYYTKVFPLPNGQKIRFVFLDTSPFAKEMYGNPYMPHIPGQDTAKQIRWVETTLSNATEDWKLVVGHHPVYSASKVHGNTHELIDRLKPLLEKYKVPAYICGHDHDLQHLQPKGSPVDYFISGGGSEAREVETNENSLFAKTSTGFADINIQGDSLHLCFIDGNGVVIYKYSRIK